MTSERKLWEALASEHPYWTVLVEPRYRADRLGPEDVRAFFQTGSDEIAATFASIRRYLAPDFRPRRALDYGCGVGRLTMPMARECERVLGVDVSEHMLTEARKNCAEHGIQNVEFASAESFLSSTDERFSFDF